MPYKNTKDPYVKRKLAEYARRYRERHPERFNQPKTDAQRESAKAATIRYRLKNRAKVNSDSRTKSMQKRRAAGIPERKPGRTKEEQRARARELYHLNLEKSREKSRRCNDKRKEYTARKNKEYREQHGEELKVRRSVQRQQWTPEEREANNSKERSYYRKDASKSKVRQAAKSAKRRAIKKGSEGIVTARQIADLYIRQGGRCATCKNAISKSGSNRFHVDHVKPLANGGLNVIENVALLCESCNLRKGTSDPFEWAKKHGLLFF